MGSSPISSSNVHLAALTELTPVSGGALLELVPRDPGCRRYGGLTSTGPSQSNSYLMTSGRRPARRSDRSEPNRAAAPAFS
jgi:hypothetical protein